MVELMERLIDSGHAYAAGGDVYFDVRSFPGYGALSGQRLDEVVQGETEAVGKRDPRDFTLWKAAKPGEPAWSTPWGRGRPGWHLECSAMATFYLGPEFDIHGGGIDLVFPHHENERAQSNAAGDPFARFWLHNAWVTLGGEKMSKSLGNTLSIDALLRRVRGAELRYYLVAPHYRSMIEYSDAALDEAVAAFRRIESFVHRVRERVGRPEAAPEVPAAFAAALDDDLGTPGALAVVHGAVREGNTALDAGDRTAAANRAVVRAGDDGRARPRPARPPLGGHGSGRGRRVRTEHAGRRPPRTAAGGRGPAATSPSRTPCATGSPPPASPSRTHPTAPPGHSRTHRHMAGNSHRRGATRKDGTKKGMVVGSGGQRRRALEGRGPTPARGAAQGPPRAAAGRRGGEARGEGRRPRPSPAPGEAPRRRRARDRARPQPGGRVPARRRAGHRAARGAGHHRGRAGRRGRAARGRRRDLDPRGAAQRPRPDRRRRAAPGRRAAGARRTSTRIPDDLLEAAADGADPALIVALDGVTDPRNLGAVVRSVSAFGGHGVVVPQRRSASMTAVAWRTSAGTAARLPVARATNLTRTLREYATAGLMIAGLDAEGSVSLDEFDLAADPLVLVIGSEGKGLSRLVRQTCDVTVSIPMAGPVESLNASVAAGVVLAEVARRRRAAS